MLMTNGRGGLLHLEAARQQLPPSRFECMHYKMKNVNMIWENENYRQNTIYLIVENRMLFISPMKIVFLGGENNYSFSWC